MTNMKTQDWEAVEGIIEDSFAFEAATKGPESAFLPGDLVRPTFTTEPMLGHVVKTIPPHRVKYAGHKHGEIVVNWGQPYGTTTFEPHSLTRCKSDDLVRITAKYRGKCGGCGDRVQQSEGVYYSPSCKTVFHVNCA